MLLPGLVSFSRVASGERPAGRFGRGGQFEGGEGGFAIRSFDLLAGEFLALRIEQDDFGFERAEAGGFDDHRDADVLAEEGGDRWAGGAQDEVAGGVAGTEAEGVERAAAGAQEEGERLEARRGR